MKVKERKCYRVDLGLSFSFAASMLAVADSLCTFVLSSGNAQKWCPLYRVFVKAELNKPCKPYAFNQCELLLLIIIFGPVLTRMLAEMETKMETVLWKYLSFEHFRKEGKQSQSYQLASLLCHLGSALDQITECFTWLSSTDTIV